MEEDSIDDDDDDVQKSIENKMYVPRIIALSLIRPCT